MKDFLVRQYNTGYAGYRLQPGDLLDIVCWVKPCPGTSDRSASMNGFIAVGVRVDIRTGCFGKNNPALQGVERKV